MERIGEEKLTESRCLEKRREEGGRGGMRLRWEDCIDRPGKRGRRANYTHYSYPGYTDICRSTELVITYVDRHMTRRHVCTNCCVRACVHALRFA